MRKRNKTASNKATNKGTVGKETVSMKTLSEEPASKNTAKNESAKTEPEKTESAKAAINVMEVLQDSLERPEREPYMKTFLQHTCRLPQLEALNNEQLGELMRAVYRYADCGNPGPVTDSVVAAMLIFFIQQMDIDHKRYDNTCERRREAARKAGKASAAKRAQEKAMQQETASDLVLELKPDGNDATTVNEGQPYNENENHNHNQNQNQNENENENQNDFIKPDDDDDNHDAEDARGCEGRLICYGKNQIPTTAETIAQVEQLTRALFQAYQHRKPSQYDYEQVLQCVYDMACTESGQHYARYSSQKAELLCHAFEQAAQYGHTSWKYVNRICDNYQQHGIQTVEEAIHYEFQWDRGEVV